ncbi:ATP-dependent RNA helicase TDRD9 [Acropora cervicornis]|uniref:RNA helicase n=1 Tax=Acropora cervicornis TaxID=6130 RepID=A0AAD9VAL3_ACRCE|nr:ATP-dependent RNA helicase TDRD9 [Acropora cervicornis]
MGDISLDMIKDFYSLKPLSKANNMTDAKITGRLLQHEPQDFRGELKLPKKNVQSPPTSPSFIGGYCSTGPKLEDLYDEMDQLESNPPLVVSDEEPAALREKEASHIFDNYSFDHTYSSDLPITSYRQQIVDTIESNSELPVVGRPPRFPNEYAKDQRYCNIIVTQPRRIAAVSISKRVCQERGWTQGSLVGYQIGRDKCISEDTRLSYVTTDVLLNKLIQEKNMNQFTHVILDEVHERDQSTDFCLLVVKKLLRTNSRLVKVVLMSATIQSDLFSMYFAVPVRGKVEGAPVVTVEGKSFNVVECYLEDLKDIAMLPDIIAEEPGIDRTGYELVGHLICHLDELEHTKSLRLWILPLHSKITSLEQGDVFKKPQEGFRKVILSTNIAESSITVPDIKYVIDFCLVKCLVCDAETNYQSLRMQWSSKASCIQRKGRAGRVSTGYCFRMVTRQFYESFIPEFGIPEMKRCPLSQLILRVKLFDIGPPKAILNLALQPPDTDDIERTILLLKQVGALTVHMRNGTINPWDGELTFIGKVIGQLPIDVHLGKLLVLSYVFGCLEECLVISAALSLRSFFANPYKREFEAYSKKMSWSESSYSDCITVLNAYKEWSMLKRRKGFPRGEHNWCSENFIQAGRIREVEEVIKELASRLKEFNIISIKPLHHKNSGSAESMRILKIVICGAFYPNYFSSSDLDEAEVMKIMSGHDPCTTVIVRNMPPHGALYRSAIARMFRQCGKGKALFFEDTRAYIEFETPPSVEQQSNVLPAVYKAIKMRQLRMPLKLFISEAKSKQMDQYMEQRSSIADRIATSLLARDSSSVGRVDPNQINLPKKGYLEIVTSVVIDAGHFWAQKPESESARGLQRLQDRINNNEGRNLRPINRRSLQIGMPCVALFEEDEMFYRAKLVSFKDNFHMEVFFVDFGNAALVHVRHLREMQQEFMSLPFQAFECMLCELAPVPTAHCPAGAWSKRATQRFIELTENRKLAAKLLIDEGFAMYQEESHASKMAHQNASSEGDHDNITWLDPVRDMEALEVQDRDDVCTMVTLRGPESPIEMSFYSTTNIGRLRDTTLMPNIHGLLSIVSLLFAPCAELRTDPEKRQYTGALVGLGYDPITGYALLPDHDSELVFEVEITQDDIIQINSVRTAINMAFESDEERSQWGTSVVERLQNSSRRTINKLVLKHRETKKPLGFPRPCRWNQIDPAYKMEPGKDKSETECAPYTLHDGIAISNRPLEEEDENNRVKKAEMMEKMEWLRSLEGRSSELFRHEVVCPLCMVQCRHPRGVSIHLRSHTHRDLEHHLHND